MVCIFFFASSMKIEKAPVTFSMDRKLTDRNLWPCTVVSMGLQRQIIKTCPCAPPWESSIFSDAPANACSSQRDHCGLPAQLRHQRSNQERIKFNMKKKMKEWSALTYLVAEQNLLEEYVIVGDVLSADEVHEREDPQLVVGQLAAISGDEEVVQGATPASDGSSPCTAPYIRHRSCCIGPDIIATPAQLHPTRP